MVVQRENCMRRAMCVMALCLAMAASAWASVTGSISGTVKDNSGAIVPGATVVATNLATGVKAETQTNSEGVYSFLALPAGKYQVDVTLSGFKDFRKTDITVNANDVLRLDVPLELGTVTDTVEVTANAVRVETSSTQLGDVIDSTKMTTEPLNGRSYIDLLGLQPGVVPVNHNRSTSGEVSGGLAAGNVSVSGARENSNGFMVNGGSVQEQEGNGTAVIPNLDSIAEFRVLTNAFDAEYGNYNGGIVNVITKSGANDWHGTGFQFWRNQNLDANNYFNNYNNVPKGDYSRNQYGGTFGGPIKRDKAFFFVDYQGTRENIGASQTTVVPSDANRTGDLSDIADQLSGNVNGAAWASVLQQRLGYAVKSGEPYYFPGCTAANCVFPGARIPTSAWASPAAPLLAYVPKANGSLEGSPSFSTSAYNNVVHDNKWSMKLDTLTRFGMLSGYYFYDQSLNDDPFPQANVPGFNAATKVKAQQANIGLNTTIGSSMVNEARINFLRNATNRTQYEGGVGPTLDSLGFVTGANTLGIVPVINGLNSVPNINTLNWNIGTPSGMTGQFNNIYQVLDNFSMLKGNHTIKFGGEFHYSQINERNIYAPNGNFDFDGSETGSDYADFLIGAPADYIQATQQVLDSRTYYLGAYAQDSWRLKPTMTLNYGLRWEVSPFWWDTGNKIQTIVPGQQSTVFPGAPTGWVFPGDAGIPKTLAPTHYNNFAPRVGFAWSPDFKEGFAKKLFGASGESSIHASWGIFYTSTDDSQLFVEVGDAPFGLFYFSPAPPEFATPFVDRATGISEGQRFPRPLPKPGDTNIDWDAFLPIASSPAIFTGDKLPYSQNFSVTFQRQLGPSLVASAGYVGTRGRRMLAAVEANPGYADVCLGLSQQSQVAPGSPVCGPNGENVEYTRANGQVVEGTRAPLGIDFAAGNQYMMTIAHSDYNSLQTSLRYAGKGLTFLVGYTLGKAQDNSSARGDALNPFNYEATYSRSSFDVRHNFVVSYSYLLPFEKWVGHDSRLLGGWQISGVTRMTSGFPITMSEGDDRSLIGTFGVDRPQFNGGDLSTNNPRETLNWINNAKQTFSVEPLGQVGNSPRRFITGPGINNTDLALLKNLNLTPGTSLQFRAELFNAFNHTQFLNPSGNINSSSFMVIKSAADPRIGQLAVKFLF